MGGAGERSGKWREVVVEGDRGGDMGRRDKVAGVRGVWKDGGGRGRG